MKICKAVQAEGLVEYAQRLAELYAGMHSMAERKSKGQFFTPAQVSRYMASLFEIEGRSFRLLDPGAGTGSLTAAFCERLLNVSKNLSLTIDAYENDPTLVDSLKRVFEACKLRLQDKGHSVAYNIFQEDFILSQGDPFRPALSLWEVEGDVSYDFVISNPPYYKLNKQAPQSAVMRELICGQPNIYALFMALSASKLRPDGQMVFITPRSFCSGLYYKRFRECLLRQVQIQYIHTFESRKEIFNKDDVLQENVILKAKKSKECKDPKTITITVTKDKDLSRLRKLEVSADDVIDTQNGQTFIRIPTSRLDIDILHIIDSWPKTLRDLGLEISTGPVVPFRATEYLLSELSDDPNAAPLLWMENIKNMEVVWPSNKKKPRAIRICDRSRRLLLPIKNYVLVKRFTSKEQLRRLNAAVLLESEFHYDTVGIENHVNYIHKPNGNLTVEEAFGIAAILNTRLVDNFFRSISGNTQVNAVELRCLPLPPIEDVKMIGRLTRKARSCGKWPNFDKVVTEILGISSDALERLTGKFRHEQD